MKTKITYLNKYQPSSFLIPSTFLEFNLDHKKTIVKSQLKIIRNNDSDCDLVLDGENLELLSVLIDGKPTTFKLTEQHLIIPVSVQQFTLEIVVAIYPEKNLSGLGLYISKGIFCTQNEPHGFRKITYFLDRPDILTKFKVLVHAPKDFEVVVSNGNLIKQILSQGMQHVEWEDPFPKSAYLFALVAGKLSTITDQYQTTNGKTITLKIHAAANKISACKKALFFLKQAMRWDEEVFGLFYDLNLYQIVAIDDFNFGAMENKGLNIFNSKVLLADPEIATDADYRRIASVIAHEYFHNWTGNRVTLKNWFQIGLKEGLTTLREQLFMEDNYGKDYSRLESIQYLENYQFVEDESSLAHPIQPSSYKAIDNFYTATVYEKSSEVFRTLISRFGRSTFVEILKKFIQKFDGNYAEIADFFEVASEITNIKLNDFYNTWYHQKGLVKVKIQEKNFSKYFRVHLTQVNNKSTKNFEIPIDFLTINLTKNQLIMEKLILKNKKLVKKINKNKEDLFWCPGLANLSAPVKISLENVDSLLKIHQYPEALKNLPAFNIWQVCQTLIQKTVHSPSLFIDSLVEVFRLLLPLQTLPTNVFTFPAIKKLLLDTGLFLKELQINHYFVEAQLAKNLSSLWMSIYKSTSISKTTYNFNLSAFNQRSFKNLAIKFILKTDDPPYFLALEQLKKADNLTDRMGALLALLASNYKEIPSLLDKLPWQKNEELYNKWLFLNALWNDNLVLERIQNIMASPSFRITNPNNVYSLVRTFTNFNLIHFHTKQGYAWFVNLILKLEKFNPSVAANLTQSFIFKIGLPDDLLNLQKEALLTLRNEAESINLLEIVQTGLLS